MFNLNGLNGVCFELQSNTGGQKWVVYERKFALTMRRQKLLVLINPAGIETLDLTRFEFNKVHCIFTYINALFSIWEMI